MVSKVQKFFESKESKQRAILHHERGRTDIARVFSFLQRANLRAPNNFPAHHFYDVPITLVQLECLEMNRFRTPLNEKLRNVLFAMLGTTSLQSYNLTPFMTLEKLEARWTTPTTSPKAYVCPDAPRKI